jgi:hypothetical protein
LQGTHTKEQGALQMTVQETKLAIINEEMNNLSNQIDEHNKLWLAQSSTATIANKRRSWFTLGVTVSFAAAAISYWLLKFPVWTLYVACVTVWVDAIYNVICVRRVRESNLCCVQKLGTMFEEFERLLTARELVLERTDETVN